MRRNNNAEFFCKSERGVKFFVRDSERAFVSEKDFETAVPALHDFHEIALSFVVVARDTHMEGEIAGTLALRFAEPEFESFERFIAAARANHLYESRRPADERGAARALMGILGKRAHERQVDVHVRIDEPGKDIFSDGVDYLRVVRRGEIAIDSCDRFTLAKNVGDVAPARSHHLPVFDEKSHGWRVLSL